MRVLVTGGTGYLGSEVVPRLLEKHEVVVLTHRQRVGGPEMHRGDIAKLEDVRSAMEGCDAVVHMAVESAHSRPWSQHYRVTVQGTENICRAALEAGVRRVVHISSMAVEARTRTNYVRAKAGAEAAVKRFWDRLEIPVLRPSSVYDAGRVELAARAARFPLPAVATRFRPVFRTTLVDCIESALRSGESRIYQVGDAEPVKLLDFLRASAWPRRPLLLPGFLAAPARLIPRVRFTLEDKLFEIDMDELRVEPVRTLETIFRIKFGDSWEGEWRKFK
jgi:nucleoside-diphosphate-sugar epimerase